LPTTKRRTSGSTQSRSSGRKPASKTPVRSRAGGGKAAPGASRRTSKPRTLRSRRNAAPQPHQPTLWESLSPERKLDILGGILALLGLISLLSLLSPKQGALTGAWVMMIKQVAGWGAFVLPIALLVIGLWLVLRHIERLPLPSVERAAGVALLYLNLLAWMHILAPGTDPWAIAKAGQGGGYLGGFFAWILQSALGKAGAVVILLAWLVVSIIFTFDISVPDLTRKADRLLKQPVGPRGAVRQTPPPPPNWPDEDAPVNIPADFHPLPDTKAPPRRAGAARTAQPAAAKPDAFSETPVRPARSAAQWPIPAVEVILDPPTPASAQSSMDHERAHLIEETLTSLGAPSHVVEVHRGPTVTQFGVEPDFIETRGGNRTRVRVAKIANLADDLALALAASRVRIQAPVPGRNYVGIEVPNQEISVVSLREVMESEPFQKSRAPLRLALGKNVSGQSIIADLTAMPHLLIAGTTGSGKSVCVNAILSCLLLTHSPATLRLVLVDPKRVELTNYNGVPHLLAPVVVEADRVGGALQWMQREMDARYHKFSGENARNIVEYNRRHPDDPLPYLVVVIDELADLMMIAPEETERSLTRLAQLARATGIHLILATQRPSVDVLTGLIKANFPARIAFAVATGIDSRVILDQPGAERLLGRGDMLFQAPDSPAPVRVQGVYVSDPEINRLVDTWRVVASHVPTPTSVPGGPVDALPAGLPMKQVPLWDEMGSKPGDPLIDDAAELVRKEGRASITMLQRRLGVGYSRAARLIDALEERGVISAPQPNSQVREVLDYGNLAPPEDDGA